MSPTYTYHEMIAALVLAALTTGIYFCTLVYCLRWLIFSDQGWTIRKRIDWTMLTPTLALFGLSTAHTVLAGTTTVELVDNVVKGIPADLSKLPWSATMMCAVTNLSVLIADALLIYRCWVVCLKSWKSVALPILFWVGGLACTFLQLYLQSVKSAEIKNAWLPVNTDIGPGTVLTPFWACTIVVNVYTTFRIIYRIWQEVKELQKVLNPARDLRFVIQILIESGALYLMVTIPHFIVWWTPSGGAILGLGWINLPIVCSAFNLIIIRSSHHRVEEEKKAEENAMVSAIEFGAPKEGTRDVNEGTFDYSTPRRREESSSMTVSAESIPIYGDAYGAV